MSSPAATQRNAATMPGMNRACGITGEPAAEPEVTLRLACKDDEADWRELWAAYTRFSRVDLPAAVTDATWARIVTPDSPMGALVAADAKGRLIAFGIFVVHAYSFDDRPACLIDDAYVQPEARGLGIGTRLISFLIERADMEGWGRVYWVAHQSNAVACRTFDRHFGCRDGYLRYTVDRPSQMK